MLHLLALGVSTPPTFDLNLSAPARMRWHGALAATLARHPYESSWLPTFTEHNKSLFSKLQPDDWTTLTSVFEAHFPENAEELRGIHDDFNALLPDAGITFEYLVGWVYFHELAHTPMAQAFSSASRECTALLARAPDVAAGLVHVGNMDQSPPAVRNITLEVTFRGHDGSVSFRGVDWYAVLGRTPRSPTRRLSWLGLLTGKPLYHGARIGRYWFTTGVSRTVKAGLASLQENWRSGYRSTADIFASIAAGAVPQILVFREAFRLFGMGEYTKLQTWLENVPLAAPFYVITATANGEGVVLARSADGVDGKDALGNASVSTLEANPADARNSEGDDWFLVQTNYDHWLVDPSTDPRRTQAEVMLRDMGKKRGATPLSLFAVASSYPVHNPHTA
mmetsp:Transcript_4857/g.12933  ORF Transcript_4857/g.12933 Transcript_4857/m.12933 type:complete len:394 (-) Transcript_4857:493-1674(-)